MFYSTEVLAHRGAEFFVIWQMSNRNLKIDKRSIMDQNVTDLCQSIEKMIPNLEDFKGSKKKMSLYLLAKLVFGTVLVHREQAFFLEKDVRGLIDSLKQKSLILKCAKEFEKEFKRKKEKESERKRTSKVIDLDDGEDLADLEKIGQRLEINANPMDITLQDDLRSLSTMKFPFIDDLAFMEDLFKENPVQQTTFVDGHISDGSNRESVVNGAPDTAKVLKIFEQNENIMDISPIPAPIDPLIDFSAILPSDEPIVDISAIPPPIEPIPEVAPINDLVQTVPPIEPIVETPPPIKKTVPKAKARSPKLAEEPNYEPTPKRSRIEIDREETARKTPVNFSKIEQVNEDELELDSQIVMDVPLRPKRSRRQRPIYQGANQIEETEMMDMRRDYSTLLRDKKDVMVSVEPVYPTLEQLLDPVPLFFRTKRLPTELFQLYGSGKFEDIGTFARDEDEESSIGDPIEKDRQELFLSTFLLPPEETLLEDPIINDQQISHILDLNQEIFDVQPLPLPPQPENDTTEGQAHEKVRFSTGLNDIVVPQPRKSTLYDATPLVESLETAPSTIPATEKAECHFFSSGSLIDARCELENQLFDQVKDAHPDWIDFNGFTNGMTSKMAACAFNVVLEFAKQQKVEVKQAGGFEPIFLRQLCEEISTLSIKSGSSPSLNLE